MLVIGCVSNWVKTESVTEVITDQDEPGHYLDFDKMTLIHFGSFVIYFCVFLSSSSCKTLIFHVNNLVALNNLY